eukprot:7669539-Lingulodinium_polyedra.AAC.1
MPTGVDVRLSSCLALKTRRTHGQTPEKKTQMKHNQHVSTPNADKMWRSTGPKNGKLRGA